MPSAARSINSPAWWARGLTWLAATTLPRSARARYRREFVADLHELTRPQQASYALHVLACALPLRLAVGSGTQDPVLEAIDMTTRRHRPLRCLLNVRHEWHTESTEDGSRYARCRRCGKDATGPVVTSDDVNIAAHSANLFGLGGGGGL